MNEEKAGEKERGTYFFTFERVKTVLTAAKLSYLVATVANW